MRKTNGGEQVQGIFSQAVRRPADPKVEHEFYIAAPLAKMLRGGGVRATAHRRGQLLATTENILQLFELVGGNVAQIEEIRSRLGALEETISSAHVNVEYVTPTPERPEQATLAPALFRRFYAMSMSLTLIFGASLFLNGFGVDLVHPLISGVGFLGSLGWLTTAATDLRDWKVGIARKSP